MYVVMAMAEQTRNAPAARGSHNFVGIGGADGVDFGGVVNAPRHEVNRPKWLLVQGVGEDAHVLENFPIGLPLVGQIVDGEEGGDAPEAWIGRAGRGQPCDGGGGVPIVGVEHIRPPTLHHHGKLQGGTAEKSEAVGIVFVAVDRRPTKQIALGDKVDGDFGVGQFALKRARGDVVWPHGHIKGLPNGLDVETAAVIPLLNRPISGHHYPHIVSQGG